MYVTSLLLVAWVTNLITRDSFYEKLNAERTECMESMRKLEQMYLDVIDSLQREHQNQLRQTREKSYQLGWEKKEEEWEQKLPGLLLTARSEERKLADFDWQEKTQKLISKAEATGYELGAKEKELAMQNKLQEAYHCIDSLKSKQSKPQRNFFHAQTKDHKSRKPMTGGKWTSNSTKKTEDLSMGEKAILYLSAFVIGFLGMKQFLRWFFRRRMLFFA